MKKNLKKWDLIKTETAPYAGNLFLVVRRGGKLMALDLIDTRLTFSLGASYFNTFENLGNVDEEESKD
jgi:hypothetical protein